jgi:hypothetical protein
VRFFPCPLPLAPRPRSTFVLSSQAPSITSPVGAIARQPMVDDMRQVNGHHTQAYNRLALKCAQGANNSASKSSTWPLVASSILPSLFTSRLLSTVRI